MDQVLLPVLVYVSRDASPGREDELVRWAQELSAAAATFKGYLGSSVRVSNSLDGTSVLLGVRFESATELIEWENSELRQQRLAEGTLLTEGRPIAISLQELETQLSGGSGRAVPRWRAAVAVWLALFPVALLSNWLLSPVLATLSWPLPILISSMLTVATVIWVTLPVVHSSLATIGRRRRRRRRIRRG